MDARYIKKVTLTSTVETIQIKAFAYNYILETVELNDGLKTIEQDGLASEDICRSLPSSVTWLGQSALLYTQDAPDLILPPNLTHIDWRAIRGKKNNGGLIHIGQTRIPISTKLEFNQNAFKDLWFAGFDVPEDDPSYKAVGPLLMDKGGSKVLLCAPNTEEVIYVPEGTRSIGFRCFETLPLAHRIYLPDSVKEIEDQNVSNSRLEFYVHADSPLITSLEEQGLTWKIWE